MGGLCHDLVNLLYVIHSLKTSSRSNKYLSEFPIFCQMSKSKTTALWMGFIKNELDIMRYRHNKVNFVAAFDDHQNASKCS